MFLNQYLFNFNSHTMSLQSVITRTLVLLSVILVLTNGSPVPDSSMLPASDSIHKRSPRQVLTDDNKICYPKTTTDKMTQLNSDKSKTFQSLKIMELTIDNSEQFVGVLPETAELMFNDELSQCIIKSTVMQVPGLFPEKILITECDTSCSALTDSKIQLFNVHVSVYVLRRDFATCNANGQEEKWELHNVKIPQCRKF